MTGVHVLVDVDIRKVKRRRRREKWRREKRRRKRRRLGRRSAMTRRKGWTPRASPLR